ncbi:caspase family protein [candidate division FCPU426 bacterium]|nr:caspase family protein [candidate division FCPU426 bacterium]
MHYRKTAFILLFFLTAGILIPAAGNAVNKDTVRRFALVVGANDGGKERPKLRYAVTDAKAFTYLLQKIGGVFPIDCIFLVEPDREAFMNGLARLRDKIQNAQASANKIEMIFYYSGHSDEEAVLLGPDKIAYKNIKQAIERTPADVRIAILDSCSSGAFTRLKGGKMRPPFLIDSSYDMKGYAFLTSSSSDEVSQESDRLQSSFFTHYLIAGLRGAADMSLDGRVTLNEAYQYAYHETLLKTEKTLGGPQHPNYNIQMSGTGDVVMTDIRNSSAILTLDKTLQGRIFIRDTDEHVILEMRKPGGRAMQIGLEEGKYSISNEREQALFETQVDLALGQEFVLAPSHFTEIQREPALARGREEKIHAEYNDQGLKVVPWDFCLTPDAEQYGNIIHYYVFGLVGTYSVQLDGFAISLGPNVVKSDSRGAMFSCIGNYVGGKMQAAQLSGIFNICRGEMEGIQFSGVLNEAENNVTGVQYAGIASMNNGSLAGAQIGGVFTFAKGRVKGVQTAGVFTMAAGPLLGAQAAGVFTWAEGQVEGAQAAGVFALAEGKVAGFQVAGIFTHTPEDLEGVQAATVNIAGRSRGLQVGVLNIAGEQNGVPVGLVNISENGSVEVVAWHDSLADFNLGVKCRAGYFYSIISTSKQSPRASFDEGWGAGLHYGGHIPLRPFYLELDLGYSVQNNRPTDRYDASDLQIAQARLLAGITWWDRFSLFIGTGAAYIYRGEFHNRETPDTRFPIHTSEWELIEEKWEPITLAGAAFSF